MRNPDLMAAGLLGAPPHEDAYRGLGAKDCSELMEAMCRRASETGQTAMAAKHLPLIEAQREVAMRSAA